MKLTCWLCIVRAILNRETVRSRRERALERIRFFGGSVTVHLIPNGTHLPIVPGLNDGQMLDDDVDVHVFD